MLWIILSFDQALIELSWATHKWLMRLEDKNAPPAAAALKAELMRESKREKDWEKIPEAISVLSKADQLPVWLGF